MTRRQRRLTMIGGSLAVLGIAAALVLNAMRDSIVFFSTPAVVVEKHIPAGRRFRLGGLVEPGSLVPGARSAVPFPVGYGQPRRRLPLRGMPPPRPGLPLPPRPGAWSLAAGNPWCCPSCCPPS